MLKPRSRSCRTQQKQRAVHSFHTPLRPNQLASIPGAQMFDSAQLGFQSFFLHQKSQKPLSPLSRSHLHHHTQQPQPSSSVAQQLQHNRSNLCRLHSKISRRRQKQYQSYVESSLKYNKLLELNNNRSKVLTSLHNKKVGEVKITQVDSMRFSEVQYEARDERLEVRGVRPEPREGQTCVVFRDCVYVLGGHNNYPFERINVFSFRESEWVRTIETQQIKRTYHSIVVYKKYYAILFGGMGVYNSHYKTRECLNSCVLFNLTNSHVKRIKIENEDDVEGRRNHSACLVGKNMLVFGGINTRKEYLGDMVYLDLKALQWNHKEYKVEDYNLSQFLQSGLAKHACFTYFKQRDSHPFYSKTYQQPQGIYFFGGTNQHQHQNLLLQLKLSTRIPTLQPLTPKGLPPSPTYPQVLQYNPTSVLIASGERQQRQFKLFKILECEFIGMSNQPSLRSLGGVGSSLVGYEGNYYLMFGLSEKGYLGAITRVRVEERVVERDRRKQYSMFRRQTFFVDESSCQAPSEPIQ